MCVKADSEFMYSEYAQPFIEASHKVPSELHHWEGSQSSQTSSGCTLVPSDMHDVYWCFLNSRPARECSVCDVIKLQTVQTCLN